MLSLISNERSGAKIPPEQLIKLSKGIKSIYQLGCQQDVSIKFIKGEVEDHIYEGQINPSYYIGNFQNKLIEEIGNYYNNQAQKWFSLSVIGYAKQDNFFLLWEATRAEKYYPFSKEPILAELRKLKNENRKGFLNGKFGTDCTTAILSCLSN